MPNNKRNNFFQLIVLFALIYLSTQMALRYFFPDQFGPDANRVGVSIEATDRSIKDGHHPILTLRNDTETDLVLEDRCPMPPVDVFFVGEGNTLEKLETAETALDCLPLTAVKAGESAVIDLSPWKYSLFSRLGTYEVELPIASGSVVAAPTTEGSQYREGIIERFEISKAGVITQLFRTFITKPFLNSLIWIAEYMPGYNLGLAIIILTLIVKLVLFLPTQHAMEGQKKLQLIQPKVEVLKKQYKNDPKKLQEETMKLWKEYKVNPFQSCLPMLIQFPVLIGLFYVIRDGSVLALSQHLLYAPHLDLSWNFGTNFLGMDLEQPNWILPPLLIVFQFLQMKLSFAINDKKKAAKQTEEKKNTDGPDPMKMQQTMMLYGLPLMIGFFAINFPAAVSLYWGVSTIFAIGQQLIVNREHITVR